MKLTYTTVILIIIPLLVLSFFIACKSEQAEVIRTHYVDSTLTRAAQVKKCGSCHQDVYINWKMGPHAYAYQGLVKHQELIATSKNFPDTYNEFIAMRMENTCITCHTGKNIFETNFAGISHTLNPALINKDSMPKAFEQAFGRDFKNKNELATGVDCITCHVQNKQVVTNSDSKAPDTLGLIKSNLFSDNMNCYSCHHHQVSTMKELVDKTTLPAEIKCVNCHQEYKPDGKGTHYFYWRNDHASKKRPKHLDIFECATVAVTTNSGKPGIEFSWTNTVMPHGYSECGDAKCEVVAVLKNKKEKVIHTELLNRKDFFDAIKEMPPHFHTGKNGHAFAYKEALVKQLEWSEVMNQADYFLIRGFVKPQYWSTDKEFVKVYEREVRFKLP